MSDTMSRKERAVRFLRLAASGQVDEAYGRYVGASFRHHNPWFPGDPASLKRAMAENSEQNPGKVFEVLRALEDGDLVAVHSRVRPKPADLGAAVVHIFRFEGDWIVELWDVGQPVPESGVNEHGMF